MGAKTQSEKHSYINDKSFFMCITRNLSYLFFFMFFSYALMFSCWLLSPKDRPSFETLRCELEKALEDLPDPQDPDEILYVNMDESSMELGAVGGRDPISGPLCLKGLDSVTTVEVHHPNRYVLCPQHETIRALSDSLESLDMPVSSSTATLPLHTSCHSTPNPTPAPTPTVELLEEREGSRRMAWQWRRCFRTLTGLATAKVCQGFAQVRKQDPASCCWLKAAC